MHEIVSDGSSRAENWTDLRKISMRVFFDSKTMRQNENMVEKKHKNVVFRANISLRSYTGHTKVGKNKKSDIIYLNLIDLIIYN